MAILFKNNAASTLSSIYISSTGKFSDLYVADSSVFPSITAGTGDYFYLTLVGDDTLEIVKAFETGTNSSGGKYIRVYRAQEDTVQQDWPVGTRVEMRITAGALQSFFSTIATTEKLGVSKLSTYQQAIEGTDNTTNMTPRRTVDAIHQFNTTVVETPTVTGTTSVRSGTTYPYTFTASVMGGFEDPIVAFYYVGNQTGDEPFIRVPVESPTTTNATATGDVSFVGDVGDVIVVTTYAETELGNVSKYGTLNVSIIANNPPDISNLEDNVPATGYANQAIHVHFSGATDEDGDTVKYRIKNMVNCTFSKTTDIADGEDVILTWKKPADYHQNATNDVANGNSSFVLEAYDNFGGSASKTYTSDITYRWDIPTVSVTSGTNPEAVITWTEITSHNNNYPTPYEISLKVLSGTDFERNIHVTSDSEEYTSRKITVTVPWNATFTVQGTVKSDATEVGSECFIRSNTASATSVVTFTAPVWTSEQGQTVTPSDRPRLTWTEGTSSPAFTPASWTAESSTDSNFSTVKKTFTKAGQPGYADFSASMWFEFDNPAVVNYLRVRNNWNDPTTNKVYSSAWSSPMLTVNGQTASLTAASISSPVANAVLDPSVATTVNIALGEVVGQTVDKMKVDVLEGDSDTIVHTSGEIAYSSSYVIPANTLDYNGTFRLRCNTHGTLTGWVDGNLTTVSTIMHKYTDQPVLISPTNSATMIKVEAAQSYSWVNASAVGVNTNSYTRLVIMDSSGSTVYTKDAGTNATSYSVPANTLSHNTTYKWKVINWFVNGGTAGVDDLTKSSTSTTWSFTTTPASYNQDFTSSTSWTVPYTGNYTIEFVGAGGGGGTTVSRADFPGAYDKRNRYWYYSGGGGGGGGYVKASMDLVAGQKYNVVIGAGGGIGSPGGDSYLSSSSGTREVCGYGGKYGGTVLNTSAPNNTTPPAFSESTGWADPKIRVAGGEGGAYSVSSNAKLITGVTGGKGGSGGKSMNWGGSNEGAIGGGEGAKASDASHSYEGGGGSQPYDQYVSGENLIYLQNGNGGGGASANYLQDVVNYSGCGAGGNGISTQYSNNGTELNGLTWTGHRAGDKAISEDYLPGFQGAGRIISNWIL